MHSCQTCQGFVPTALRACPHCDTSQPVFKKGFKRASQLVLGASITLTLSACYGVPPASLPACDDSKPDQGACQITPSPTPTPTPTESPVPDNSASPS